MTPLTPATTLATGPAQTARTHSLGTSPQTPGRDIRQQQSALTTLRRLAPRTRSDVTFNEALQVAQLQATTLTRLLGVSCADFTAEHIAGLPRMVVGYEDLDVSGLSYWNGTTWVIVLNSGDSPARQRFTLLHELKHIIDHGNTARLYGGDHRRDGQAQAEIAADYFAGCALIPKRDLKQAWGQGIQRIPALARLFNVSQQAIEVRLDQTGLAVAYDQDPSPRCARPTTTPRGQAQQFRTAYRTPKNPRTRRRATGSGGWT